MNREIKFKAWHKPTGIMYWFDLMWGNHNQGNGYIGMCRIGEDQSIRRHRDNMILIDPYDCDLMQFTGLQDRNGVDIYEGDIIKMGDNPDCWFAPRVVEFKNGSWMGGRCRIYTNQDRHDYKGDSNQDNWEVIGNIHEHKHLMK